jgi:hypothetical protein
MLQPKAYVFNLTMGQYEGANVSTPGPQEARFAAAALTGFPVMAATRDRDRSSAIDCGASGARPMTPNVRNGPHYQADLTAGRIP